MALPDVTALKPHLNIPAGQTVDDTELERTLGAAIRVVERKVGPLTPIPVVEHHLGLALAAELVLRRAPVKTLTSVEVLGGGTVTADQYVLDAEAGIVELAGGRRLHGDYTVTYEAGWAEVPEDIELATYIIAAHLWDTQRVPGRSRPGQPADQQPLRGFAIPNRAATLLAPYDIRSASS